MKTLIAPKAVLRFAIALVVLVLLAYWPVVRTDSNLKCLAPPVEHALIGRTCPLVGRLGDIKLAVPQHYVLGPFIYKGVDIWNPESFRNRPKSPSFETEIDSFAIRVRLLDFRPIESREDDDDYGRLGELDGWKQPVSNRWIHVTYEFYDVNRTQATQREQLQNWLKSQAGPFVLQRTRSWGLQHFVSPAKRETLNPRMELFFDEATEDLFFRCEEIATASSAEMPFTVCHMEFLIRDMRLRARVSGLNFKEDLAQWRDIERHVRQTVKSFVMP